MAEHCFSVTLRRGGAVSTVVDVPDRFVAHETPVVVLAHGAGVGMRHDFMETFATALAERGLAAVRFQFPYMERAGGGRPTETDPFDVLADTYLAVLRASAQRTGSPPGPLFIGGKSLGARVASAICAQGKVRPTGLVFLGYSLHASGKPDAARAAHLRSCKAPLLFVQGERDPLCDLPTLRAARKRLGLAGSLHVVPGGDHSYGQPPATRSRERPEMLRAADVVALFVTKCLQRR